MQLKAYSPIKAEVQLVLNSFHDFSFPQYTLTLSVHTTENTNQKLYVHTEKPV